MVMLAIHVSWDVTVLLGEKFPMISRVREPSTYVFISSSRSDSEDKDIMILGLVDTEFEGTTVL
jgi:hypothetical protein